ncbi:hypothetical protein IWW50_000162 [Coemansia erecta]|nr:hypothetical protein IWW50_000162 [Coemansia erecta]
MPKKRKRKDAEDAEDTESRLAYSACSRSGQSRRRAQLAQLINELAGSDEPAEIARLVRETLNTPALRDAGTEVTEGASLRTVMENIRLMHTLVPAERRTAVLALAAGAFTGPELRERWKLVFGPHQLQDARRIARDHAFAIEPQPRHVPPTRRPKDDAFVQRMHEFLDTRSNVDARGERVATQSLRSLHREFVALDERNRVSLSAFRQLALNHVRLDADAEVVPDYGVLDLTTGLSIEQLLLPPPMPFGDLLLSQPPAASASAYDIPTIQSIFDFAGGLTTGNQQALQTQQPQLLQPPPQPTQIV